jgi:hypothetical protein
VDEAIRLISEHVDTPGLNPASGGHLAYIPGGGIYNAALGDYLADVFNKYAGVFYASPGAVRMENMLIRWMNDLVGYPAMASGNLTYEREPREHDRGSCCTRCKEHQGR